MDKTLHLFNNAIYLISNRTVARNPLFYNKKMCHRFLEKIEKYLSPLCEIYAYCIHNSEFQMVIKLKSREDFCIFYRDKKKDLQISPEDIPQSTYIFSKAISDLLVSTVKYFNYHNNRSGAMFAGRFFRKLIESEQELGLFISRINRMERLRIYDKRWRKVPGRYRDQRSYAIKLKDKLRCSASFSDTNNRENKILSSLKRYYETDLRGCFDKLPPKSIFSKSRPEKVQKSARGHPNST